MIYVEYQWLKVRSLKYFYKGIDSLLQLDLIIPLLFISHIMVQSPYKGF